MKKTLFTTLLAAVLLDGGSVNAGETLYASQYSSGSFTLGNGKDYTELVMDTSLTLIGAGAYPDMYNGATIRFRKDEDTEEMCCIFTSANRMANTFIFREAISPFNLTFDADAGTLIAASAGKPITLIQDLNMDSLGFCFAWTTPADSTLAINGKVSGETVVMNGVPFKYVGPQPDDYHFRSGEIGFTGYYDGSHALKLVVGDDLPEPTTGTLSLLALAALAARRRKR